MIWERHERSTLSFQFIEQASLLLLMNDFIYCILDDLKHLLYHSSRLMALFKGVQSRYNYIFKGDERIELNDSVLSYVVAKLQLS